MCMCVIVGEIGKLLVIYFGILKEERRNVEEVEEEEGRGVSLRRPGRNMQSETKERLMIIFDSCREDGITGSHRPPVSCVLMTDVW